MGGASRYRRLAEAAYPHSPWAGLRLADLRARHLLKAKDREARKRPIPKVSEFQELFPDREAGELRRMQARAARSHARTSLIKRVVAQRGLDSIAGLLDVKNGEAVEQVGREGKGALAITFHLGPTPAVWAWLASQGMGVLKLQSSQWEEVPDHWEVMRRTHAPGEGLQVLKRCQRWLRGGGWVAMAFDCHDGQDHMEEFQFLGRPVLHALGTAVLSLSTGAPILLMSSHWQDEGDRIVVEISPPIRPDAYRGGNDREAAHGLTQDLVRLTEPIFLRYPWEMNSRRLQRVLRPPVEAKANGEPAVRI